MGEKKENQDMKKIIKTVDKIEKKDQIIEKRDNKDQTLGWAFKPLLLCPFPTKSVSKLIKVKDENGRELEHRNLTWKKKSGDIVVSVLGSEEYGIPYGQDALIIYFLALEARKQKKRKIEVEFFLDFCKIFEINPRDTRRYKLIEDALNRIRNAHYKVENVGNRNRIKGKHYLYIDDIDLFVNPKNPRQKALFKQHITLSEAFWEEININKIPLNLDALRYLKGKSAVLGFYVWLSFRVWGNLNKNEMRLEKHLKMLKESGDYDKNTPEYLPDFIPFWGENGLSKQFGNIKERRHFRQEIKRWLKQTKELWPECPAEIVSEKDKDGLKISCVSLDQLDIQQNMDILLGKKIRKEIKEKNEKSKHCFCGGILKFCRGIKQDDGTRLDDYFHCFDCGKNYSKNKYPDLF